MHYKIQYTDSADRQLKINENKDKILIEEQNITEGNFLIFSDVKPIEYQVKELQDNQITTMQAISDIYIAISNTSSNSTTTS